MAEIKETKEEKETIEAKPIKATEIKVEVKAPKQSITPTAGALEAFNTDEKDLLARIAEEVTELVQLEEPGETFCNAVVPEITLGAHLQLDDGRYFTIAGLLPVDDS